ncbi:helix-turn-helix domain-containing protein [Aquimarina litoralis]|uniref:helix-turn-helix domain-containing protein n=1 Tax=Aquimarina litoralis TaxID=584605 RepID=UPI001C59E40D|nr:AraC family transcriptional regulator [Aquimarina litoralis]MBW1297283.1 helix-turn-helix domain-containing protein [Aquimarina litoralis]
MRAEVLQHIELLIGSIGVILGFFFAVFLIINRKVLPLAKMFLAIYLFAFSLRIGKSLFHNYFELDPTLRTAFLTVLLCIGPSIWLYVMYFMRPFSRLLSSHLFHYFPFVIFLSICWLIPNNGSWIFGVFYDFLIVHMSSYIVFSMWWIRKYKRTVEMNRKTEKVSWLYYFLYVNLVFIILYFLISESIIPFYLGISFLFSGVVIFLSFWALKKPFLFKNSTEKYKQSSFSIDDTNLLMQKLKIFMDSEKPFLDPEITLPKLSKQFNVSTNELSQIINQVESLNYSQFISKYRVKEAQRLMTLSQYDNMTIAAIAYDSGFSSISSFNSSFKKHTNMTPIAYRQSLKK